MARSYNKVIMIGRTTEKPNTKTAKNGGLFTVFNLAVNRTYEKETDFFQCISFGRTAEVILKYVEKGDLILVEGEIQINKWQDRNGVNRETPQIIIRNVVFLETKKKGRVEEKSIKEDEDIDLDADLKIFENLFGDLLNE